MSDMNVENKDDPFELVTSFEVIVPSDYNYDTQLASFHTKHGEEFYYFNNSINDRNYSKVTKKLQPGQHFLVKVFGIKKGMMASSDECLTKIHQEGGSLVGAQGASLAYEQGKDQLPKGKWHISFNEEETLWQDDCGHHRVPGVVAYTSGGFNFDLGIFESGWSGVVCLLCFCDLPASEAQTSDA